MSQKIKTSVEIDGSLTANSIVKSGGTASQILAADGSVVTAGSGVTISGGTISASGSAGVLSFNTRTGAVTLTSGDVTTALGYTPYNASNPAGYISSYTETDTLASVTARGATASVLSTFNDGVTIRRNLSTGQNIHTNILNNGGGYSSVVYIGSSPGADWLIGKDAYGVGNDKFQIGSWNGYSYIDITYNTTSGTINFPNNGGLTVNNNVILHAGNYSSYAVPTSRTITINGTSYDLSANRSWTVTASETDTLQTVTSRGNTSSNPIILRTSYPYMQFEDTVTGTTKFAWQQLGVTLAGSGASGGGYFTTYSQDKPFGWTIGGNQGVMTIDTSGNVQALTSSRAPIFYDANNTAYYVDPSGGSYCNNFTANQFYALGWFRNTTANTGLYNEVNGNHIYSRQGKRWGITGNDGAGSVWLDFYGNHESTYRGSVHADTSNNIGFLANDGGWGIRTVANKNVYVHGNTLYVNADNQSSSNIIMQDSDHGDRQIHCNSNRIGFLNQSGGWGSWCEDNGDFYSAGTSIGVGAMQAPVFYDYNNTAYYWEPATDASHRFQTPYGYIDIGPKNSSYCHIYTDRGSFYFNAEIDMLGNRVLHAGNYSNYAWPLQGSWKPASLASSTRLRGATSPDGGEFALAYSGGQIHPYADGFFYQNEGAYRVMDSNSIGDYTVGNYRTIADYSSDSTWYMRPNGRFVFANAHDWTQTFELLLPSGGSNNNTWAHFGQRQSNTTNGNFTGVSIRRYISGSSNLGDLQAGNMYGRIFYDDDNTAYYLDPASTSNLNGLTVANTITGSVSGSSGSVGGISASQIVYGSGSSKISSHANANEWRNSGFYENDGGGSNWPSGTWYNSINVRHSNQGNYHGFQVAMSYYDNNLWFRSYQGAGTFQGWQRAAVARSEGTNYIDHARYVYNNGAYSGSGWVEPSDLGVRYALNSTNAGNADTVDGFHGDTFFRNLGFGSGYPSWDANTIDESRSGFTYANGAPHNGCIAHFGASGYGIQLNGNYGGDTFAMRSRNGDNGTWRPWKTLYTDYNMDAPNKSGTSYYQTNTWMQLNGAYGLYCPSVNAAHFYPNNGSYGAWKIEGTRNGWGGLEFINSSNGNVSLMIGTNSATTGFHNNSYGWQLRWGSGTLYSGRGAYGGDESIVLQEDKWTNQKYFGSGGEIYATQIIDSVNTAFYFDGNNTGDSIRVAGDIVAYYSDERLKDRKGNIENALEKVLSLNGFYYTPNAKAQELGYEYKEEVGVSAQEVEAILPEIIKNAPIGQGYKTLNYGKLTPLLIEAIKEQQTQIEELKELVNKLINK